MVGESLRAGELLQVLRNTVDTVWLVRLSDCSVEILQDSMTPKLMGQVLDYRELCGVYMQEYVYPPDLDKWRENLDIEALRELCRSGKRERVFDMRFRNEQLGFGWHQSFVNVLEDESGRPDRVVVASRYVNEFRRGEIITKAVETEYDYVTYIEADTNSYVMYTSNRQSGTPVPPVASDDYEQEVAEFHRKYVPEDQRDSLTERLSLGFVGPILRERGEYVLYCKVLEDGNAREKKLRFSYFDRERNIWLLTRTDVTEVREEKRQKQLLQDALNAATAANKAKSEFLSRMSHDIRTPMNAIIGMTAIAGAHIGDRERVADSLSKITTSSKLLLSLINEVLDMSKVESGSIVLSEEKIDLAALTQSVINMVQPMIDQKRQTFEAHIGGVEHELVVGDFQRLQQVLMNLLSNATKYTGDGGHIVFEIKERPSRQRNVGCYEFSVIDDGIGMKEEFLARMFQPFERAEDEAIRSIPGTGLGLAISKNIVEMMDGSILAETEYGRGSKFTATVYLRLQKQEEWDTEPLAGLPVLVVDDDELVCTDVCARLNQLGMEGTYTLCGAEAVERVAAAHGCGEDYFAVIIDLRMPGMDGIETTRQIRARVGAGIPIIMISAYDWSEYEDQAIEAGVNGFIVKPLFQSRLVCKLRQFVLREPAALHQSLASLPRGDFSGRRVLLAEDNELNCEIAVELLSMVNLAVETAENGKIAADMVERRPEGYYDLIFMDMQMPVMDGCQACRAIRSLEKKRETRIPIIAMTANAFADDVERTRRAGMDGHLSKPIDMELLSHTLSKWLD